jgi:hypothetical protein
MLSFPLLSLQFGTSHSTCIFNHVTYTFNAIICAQDKFMARTKRKKKKKKHKAFTLTTICHVTPSISKLVKTFLKRFWVFVADGVVERLKGFILGNHPSVISHL